MKTGPTLFLKVVIFLLGAIVLYLCIFVVPSLMKTTALGIYRPICIGLYITAIPFFIALYETFKLLKYIDDNNAFSTFSIRTLKNIKYCALIIGVLYAMGMLYVFYIVPNYKVFRIETLGLVIIFASIVVATFANVLEIILQSALEIKSENDLTV